jgi:hypothetical protein
MTGTLTIELYRILKGPLYIELVHYAFATAGYRALVGL